MLLRRVRVQERQCCCIDTTLVLVPILSLFSIVYWGLKHNFFFWILRSSSETSVINEILVSLF